MSVTVCETVGDRETRGNQNKHIYDGGEVSQVVRNWP